MLQEATDKIDQLLLLMEVAMHSQCKREGSVGQGQRDTGQATFPLSDEEWAASKHEKEHPSPKYFKFDVNLSSDMPVSREDEKRFEAIRQPVLDMAQELNDRAGEPVIHAAPTGPAMMGIEVKADQLDKLLYIAHDVAEGRPRSNRTAVSADIPAPAHSDSTLLAIDPHSLQPAIKS